MKALTEEQIERLNSIGMIWDKLEDQWNKKYELAKRYFEENGNLRILQGQKIDDIDIGTWLNNQVCNYNKGKLSEDRKNLLDDIGMVWDYYDNRWQEMYNLAKEYYKEHGKLYPINDRDLSSWLQQQRWSYYEKYRRNKLSEDRIRKLEEIGMIWNPFEHSFMEMYEVAKKYYEEHGDLNVPHRYEFEGKKLNSWIQDKRKAYKKGRLSEEQITLLESIGMTWDSDQYYDSKYQKKFEQAKQYYESYGDLLIPRKGETESLGYWIKGLRKKYSEGLLTDEQIKELESIGMIWDVKQYQWDTMYAQAKEYYEKFGTMSISSKYQKEYIQLARWVANKRTAYRGNGTGKLTEEQIEQLKAIGVIEDNPEEHDESLEELESTLQGLVENKKKSSKLVKEFEKVQKSKSSKKSGVEK